MTDAYILWYIEDLLYVTKHLQITNRSKNMFELV